MGVKLREKSLKNGGVSFYLDISHGGRRWYQFLEIKARGARSSSEFKAQHKMAKDARSATEYRLSCMKNNLPDTTKYDKDFFKFIEARAEVLKVNRVYRSMVSLIKKYCGQESLAMEQVTKEFLIGFQEFLRQRKLGKAPKLRSMSSRTIYCIVHRLSTFINKAVESGYMVDNPYHRIPKTQRVKLKKKTPNFLTLDQLEIMAQRTKGIPIQLQLAFYFSCFAGLRWSDCSRLKWSQIVKQKMDGKEVTVLGTQQQKTEHKTYLPLSEQALAILQACKKLQEEKSPYVFPDLYEPEGERKRQSAAQYKMEQWKKQAGFDKLHFHLSRHTFATLTLSEGADLYTVSKLLGHTDIKHTMVYAHVVDKLKLEAVARLPVMPHGFLSDPGSANQPKVT
jgi:integrase